MSVFRIEKTKDFTIMSNHHFKNKNLSLKAKGLLSLMLSLPENWDYTTRGLACICKDGVDSISTALKELGWELGQTSKAKSIVDHWLMACNPFSDKPIRQMSLDEAGEYLEWIKHFGAEWLGVYIEEPKTL